MSIAHAPETPGLAIVSTLVLENERRWGKEAQPWQWEDAAAVLDPQGPPFHYLTRPRGASKTTDLAAVAIAWMLTQAPVGGRGYGAAADRDQGRLLLDSIQGFVMRTTMLRGAIEI